MQCPSCGNSDAKKGHQAFTNLGGKRRHRDTNTRRYECAECGHKFMTAETYLRDITSKAARAAGVTPKPVLAGAAT